MKITEFKRIGNSNKIKIFVDEEYYTTLLDETVALNNLKTHTEYSEQFLQKVIKSGQNVLAFHTGLKILSLFSKTEKEFYDYLAEKSFDKSAIDYAINKLKGYNYLNDENYVQNYIQQRRFKKGKKAIEYELKIKGIKTELIKKYLDNMIETQKTEIQKLAEKFVKNKEKDVKLKEKLFRHLASKGFDFEEINFVINNMFK